MLKKSDPSGYCRPDRFSVPNTPWPRPDVANVHRSDDQYGGGHKECQPRMGATVPIIFVDFRKQNMIRGLSLTTVCLVVALAGCGANSHEDRPSGSNTASDAIAHDLTTPEGAILSLEDAYRAQDIEAAVRCKDFTVEAKLMLQKLNRDFSGDPEILSKTAEVLELGFRSELSNSGFPDFRDVESTFSDKNSYQGRDDVVEITEHCRHGDGTTTTNTLVVAKTGDGWKVVAVPD